MSEFPTFAEKDFDLKKWINETLRTSQSNNNNINNNNKRDGVEKQASSLRLKLQHLSSELSNSIEELSGQCLLRIPRAVREIELMKKDVNNLAARVEEFENKLSKLELETQESIEVVASLDDLKAKMSLCLKIINQSEKYKAILKEIDKVFEKQDSEEIANILCSVEESISVLKILPEFSDAEQIIDRYTQKLENLVKPKLVQTFTQRKTDEAIKFVSIFEQIGRKEHLLIYYYNSRLAPITHTWFDFENKKKEELTASLFAGWLPTFYDELEFVINEELSWTQVVFPPPPPNQHYSIVATLILKIHEEIRNSFSSRLKYEDMTLDLLINLYIKTKDFCSGLNFLDSLQQQSSQHNDGTSGALLFIDPRNKIFPSCTKKMVCFTIFAPYVPFQNEYFVKKQKEKLYASLSQLQPKLSDYIGTMNNIDNSIPNIFSVCDGAVEHCLQFTEATEIEPLIDLINDVFTRYLVILNDLLKELRNMANLNPVVSPRPQQTTSSLSDSSQFHDWGESYFQGALQFLEIVNKIITRLDNFDIRLKSQLLQQFAYIFPPGVQTIKNLNELNCFHLTDLLKAQKLHQFYLKLGDVTFKLLAQTHSGYSKFLTSAQTFVFDSMFFYIKQKLLPIPELKEWGLEVKGQIPDFSFSAQGYVKLVVEHLLVLRQLLEPYDSNEAIHLENSDKLHKGGAGTTTTATTTTTTTRTTNNNKDEIWSPTTTTGEEEMDAEKEQHEKDEHEGFASQWIAAVARATMTLFIEKILQIETLTNYGSIQLSVDISHLRNVLSALGVATDPALEQISQTLNQTKEEYEATEPKSVVSSLIAKKRGWKTTQK